MPNQQKLEKAQHWRDLATWMSDDKAREALLAEADSLEAEARHETDTGDDQHENRNHTNNLMGSQNR